MSRFVCFMTLLAVLVSATPVVALEQCDATAAMAMPVKININTATADELSAHLKGVGKAKAAAIIEWRETNGAFSSLEDLDEVKGIGPALIEKNREAILFKDE